MTLYARSRPYGAALDLEVRPGCCAFCDVPLTGAKRVMCGAPECLRAYRAVHAESRKARRTQLRHQRKATR